MKEDRDKFCPRVRSAVDLYAFLSHPDKGKITEQGNALHYKYD